ncbi:hypothetical protein CANARDRAFT_28248 [[Candida] arabinofermentans NRRL YB-2248]|uniref:Protein HRI1 n=1 Tax=[Candida] arabinofermentans NRRL YB-2248 TaxID=983967 RepID=A0A1E4T120_9ASCO|nr:hypothetical protein CANARDRAFT_28248 [[Candida] arabinofermentans NRRL YB-2248]
MLSNAVMSTRLSIQWNPTPDSKPPPEETLTMVLTSPGELFVDIRSWLNPTPAQKKFPLEWAFAGSEIELPDVDGKKVIQFNHQFFDSVYIQEYTTWSKNYNHLAKQKQKQQQLHHQTHKLAVDDSTAELDLPPMPDRSSIPLDIGYFSSFPDGRRLETGSMANPATGKVEPYEEIWVSVDPITSKPDAYRLAGSVQNSVFPYSDDELEADAKLKSKKSLDCYVFDISPAHTDKYEGRLIKLGNWLQGVFWDKSNFESPISVIRAWFDDKKGNWVRLIEVGIECEKFPLFDFEEGIGRVGEKVIVEGVHWECVECWF